MEIKNLTVTKDFKYLWLKNVIGVDLNVHCAKCLLGNYINAITGKTQVNDLILDNGIYYLCGVAYPFVWNNNFHLAFINDDSSNISYSNNGISVEIKGARQLPIDMSYCDTSHPKYYYKSYRTCRNWQFANYLYNSNLLTD